MRYGVILAGGGGTRLWPASRRRRPKQFLPLGAAPGESLLQATARRLGPLCAPERLLVVTAADQAAEVARELPGLAEDAVLAEPVPKNTAAALGLAAAVLLERDSDAVMAALPSDHHIADEAAFAELAGRALDLAADTGSIVTVGVVPTRPEPGFGYLELGDATAGGSRRVVRFVEKPDPDTARRYAGSGSHLWNAGMFFVTARRLWEEIGRHMPETFAGLSRVREALAEGGRPAAEAAAAAVYPSFASVSIDHGVMERAADVITLPGDFGWNDVGSWSALAEYRPVDPAGNVTDGQVTVIDAHRNIFVSDDDCVIAACGVRDLVVVKSGNAILIVPKDRAQDVRQIVRLLEERGLDELL